MEAENVLFPETADLIESISLSASHVVRSTDELDKSIVLQTLEKGKNLI